MPWRQRQLDHPAGNHLEQIAVGVIGQFAQCTEELHDRPHLRVVHHRQVDQALDRAIAEGPAHLLVFCSHLFRRRRVRQVDAERSQAFERRADRRGVVALPQLKKHAQATDLGLIDLRSRLDQQRLDESRGLLQVRVEDLAFRPFQEQAQHQVVGSLPPFVRQNGDACCEVIGGRGIGGRGFRLPPCNKIEFGRAHLLGPLGNERRAQVQLVDEVVDLLRDPLLHGLRDKKTCDPQMEFGATFRRNQRIGGFLNPIMEEPIASLPGDGGAGADRVAKACMHRFVGFAAQLCQGRKVSVIAQAGEQFQRFLGLRSKTAQPADHQVHRIVAEPLVDDSVQIPRPRPRARIELDQPLLRPGW